MGFPLRGEWMAPNTPGSAIPSHGTNALGSRYAYDFIKVDWNRNGLPAYKASLLRYLIFGLPISQYYCWGEKVYAPCDGRVVLVKDGIEERSRTNVWGDMVRAYKNARYFDPKKENIESVAGNYIIIKYSEDVYAALVHLQKDSLQVSLGQQVKKGECLGRVGHSGNSYAPHLHFQLMDSIDFSNAKGLPCAFEHYELLREGRWQDISRGIPTNKDRIRL